MKKKPQLKIILNDALIALVLFLSCESYLRIQKPSWAIPPTTDKLTRGHPVRYNSIGLRNEDFPIRTPKYETRILIFGNSTTFGTGVAEKDTYSSQLQRYITAEKGSYQKVRVINAGGQGGNLEQAIYFWRKYGNDIKPQLVVLGFSASMIAKTHPFKDSSQNKGNESSNIHSIKQTLQRLPLEVHKFLYKTYSYPTFDLIVRKKLYQLGVLEAQLGEQGGAVYAYAFEDPNVNLPAIEKSYELFEEQLKEFRSLIEAKNSRLLIINIPSQFEISSIKGDNPRQYNLSKARISPSREIADISEQLDIQFIDLNPVFQETRNPMLFGKETYDRLYISNDYTHLNEFGHGIVAKVLHRNFLKMQED